MLQSWDQWFTMGDEYVCAECGQLDGLLFPSDQGPVPPLHRNCRCRRRFHHQNLVDVPVIVDWGEEVDESKD